MRRREFMQMSVVFAAAAAGESAARAEPQFEGSTVVVCDTRFPAAYEFASKRWSSGAIHVHVTGDLVQEWRKAMLTRYPQEIDQIAAVTLHSDFLLLRQIAAGLGLRVVRESRVQGIRSGASRPVWLTAALFSKPVEVRA